MAATDKRSMSQRKRVLSSVTGDSFASRKKATRSLADAADDGFTLVNREEIDDREMVVVTWEIAPGFGGGDFSTVWAILDDDRRIKFQDGGTSWTGITATLRELEANGVRGDIFVKLVSHQFGDNFEYTGYSFVDPNAPDPDAAPGY